MRYFHVVQGLGQSAPYNRAVTKLQRVLSENGFELGQIDGLYGMNTHAAVLRACRDLLEPEGLIETTCRSTCNTLWNREKSACSSCLKRIITELVKVFPSSGLSVVEIDDIVTAYQGFLDAYITEYGDGGQDDPRQVARRENMPIDQAEDVVADRIAQREAADVVAEDSSGSPEYVVPPPPSGEGSTEGTTRTAGMGWWILLLAGVVGVGYYLWKTGDDETGFESPTGSSEPISGCGCGF